MRSPFNVNRKRGSLARLAIAIPLTAALLSSSCGAVPAGMAGAVASQVLRAALFRYAAQQIKALATVNAGTIAKTRAEVSADLRFESPETKVFIERWKETQGEVQQLREDFSRVHKAWDDLALALDTRAQGIKNDEIRQRTEALIEQKKTDYRATLQEADAGISSLEATVDLGNDIVTALEIAGTLGSFEQELGKLSSQNRQVLEKMGALDGVVDQGMKLLDVEFEALLKG